MLESEYSASRGASLVAVVSGLILVAILGVLGASIYAVENKPPIDKSTLSNNESRLERKRSTLGKRTDTLEKLNTYHAEAARIPADERILKMRQERVVELRKEHEEAQDQLLQARKQFFDYRNEYRKAEREGAKGEILDLSETLGPRYKECKVLSISPTRIRTSLSTGPKAIKVEKLPASIVDRFQFGEDEKNPEAARVALNPAQTKALLALKIQQEKQLFNSGLQQKINALQVEIEQKQLAAEQKFKQSLGYQQKADKLNAEASYRRLRGMSVGGRFKQAYELDKRAQKLQQQCQILKNEVGKLRNVVRGLKKDRKH